MKKMMLAIGLVAVFGGTLAGATITITTPHGGETWSVGDTIPIAWTYMRTMCHHFGHVPVITAFLMKTKSMRIALAPRL